MFERLSKHWHKSRTIIFNLVHAIPAVVLALLEYLQVTDLTPIFGPGVAASLTIYLTLANIIWRAVTTKPLEGR